MNKPINFVLALSAFTMFRSAGFPAAQLSNLDSNVRVRQVNDNNLCD
jgi:hypothetical protein